MSIQFLVELVPIAVILIAVTVTVDMATAGMVIDFANRLREDIRQVLGLIAIHICSSWFWSIAKLEWAAIPLLVKQSRSRLSGW